MTPHVTRRLHRRHHFDRPNSVGVGENAPARQVVTKAAGSGVKCKQTGGGSRLLRVGRLRGARQISSVLGVLWKTRTTRNFAGFPGIQPHSGHRAVVHHSRSETCGARLTRRPFCPQTERPNRRATSPRLKVAGASFFRGCSLERRVRIITIIAAIMIGPSLGYGSPACLTQSEARAKFSKATHLYMRNQCWSDSVAAPVHSPQRSPRAAAQAAPPRPALAAAPMPSPRPDNAGDSIDAGVQCRYSPCE
jgi:hypothetical protein